MAPDRRSMPTWQWIAVTAVGALTAVAAYAYVDTQGKIKDLSAAKADKEMVNMMYNDVQDIREMMTSHIIETGSGRIVKRRKD